MRDNRVAPNAVPMWACGAFALLSLAAAGLSAQALETATSYPRTVLLIRHAEKPDDGDPSIDLNARGDQRAAALHDLFETSATRPHPFPTPDYFFATHKSKHSQRPIDTIQPLVNGLAQMINTSFADEDVEALAFKIFHTREYAGKVVLICWHQGELPALATALKARKHPDNWKKSTYDRVWRIDYDAAGNATFSDLPEHLLPGDSND